MNRAPLKRPACSPESAGSQESHARKPDSGKGGCTLKHKQSGPCSSQKRTHCAAHTQARALPVRLAPASAAMNAPCPCFLDSRARRWSGMCPHPACVHVQVQDGLASVIHGKTCKLRSSDAGNPQNTAKLYCGQPSLTMSSGSKDPISPGLCPPRCLILHTIYKMTTAVVAYRAPATCGHLQAHLNPQDAPRSGGSSSHLS